jgi:hypothetical protein
MGSDLRTFDEALDRLEPTYRVYRVTSNRGPSVKPLGSLEPAYPVYRNGFRLQGANWSLLILGAKSP